MYGYQAMAPWKLVGVMYLADGAYPGAAADAGRSDHPLALPPPDAPREHLWACTSSSAWTTIWPTAYAIDMMEM